MSASKDNAMNMWTSGLVGACLGVAGTVFILALAFTAGHDAYCGTAWTLFLLAILVGVIELVRRGNFPTA